MTKAKKKYISQINTIFPYHNRTVHRISRQLSASIDEIILRDPNVTYEQLCTQLGSPKDICIAYLNTEGSDILYQKLRATAWVRRGIITLCLIATFTSIVFSIHINRAYNEVKSELPIYEIEYIDDSNE